jgi:microcystin-dependent protein
MASNKIIQNVTKNSKMYLVVCLLIILVVVTYKHNIENYQNIELKLQDFIVASVNKDDGGDGNKGIRGKKGPGGPQGIPGKLPLEVIKEVKSLDWLKSYEIESKDNREDIVKKFVDKIFTDVLKELPNEHTNYITESQNLANKINTFTVDKPTLSAVMDQKSYIKEYLIVAHYSGDFEKVPDGWQLCDGNNFKYSNTGEELTIKTPDLRGRFILGGDFNQSNKNNLYYLHGSTYHKIDMDELPSHSHSYAKAQNMRGFGGCIWRTGNVGTWGHGPYITDGGFHKSDSTPVGGGANHNNMPPFYTLRYIVKQPTK